ncbi:Alpha-(1,3)-fucosyltransferase C [Aphelenchoides besseyi]|nr:Alpha-(1,3)-fucosyltransferase C [Aphelenchoides besseyi]
MTELNVANKRESQEVFRFKLLRPRLLAVPVGFVLLYIYFDTSNAQLFWNKQSAVIMSLINETRRLKQPSDYKLPIVLFWTTYFDNDMSYLFVEHSECPFKCLFTSNQSFANDADVRVLHPPDFRERFPPHNPTALNAHLIFESPANAPHNGMFIADYFNITISYHSQATIFYPYNEFVEIDGTETTDQLWTQEQIESAVNFKTKKVLVSISNCHIVSSGRNEYLEALGKHIKLTKVGRCFLQHVDDQTLHKLIAEHYFIIAFENSICPEYTTEKYWRLKNLTVPVILSRGVTNSNLVLNGTFIAASDFKSPRKLADYLNSLIDDKSKYMKYFEWTKRYRRTMNGDDVPATSNSNAACQLCRLATLKPKLPPVNVQKYWNREECIGHYANELLKQSDHFKDTEQQMSAFVRNTSRKRVGHGNLLPL